MPGDYPWSSAHAHLTRQDDRLAKVAPLCAEIDDWAKFFSLDVDEETTVQLQRHERTGRPLGETSFIIELEERTGLILQRQKTGPKGPRHNKKG